LSERSDATLLALTLAAVTGALNVCINVIAWDEVRRAARGRPSAIMNAQVRSRWTKLLSSLTVQVTMTLAAIAKDPMLAAMADAVGALVVCGVMAVAAKDLLAESLPDLLDRSMDRLARPALQRLAAELRRRLPEVELSLVVRLGSGPFLPETPRLA
jgi:divalent metal cation (Fe/Co/Zn/Cd) transporter